MPRARKALLDLTLALFLTYCFKQENRLLWHCSFLTPATNNDAAGCIGGELISANNEKKILSISLTQNQWWKKESKRKLMIMQKEMEKSSARFCIVSPNQYMWSQWEFCCKPSHLHYWLTLQKVSDWVLCSKKPQKIKDAVPTPFLRLPKSEFANRTAVTYIRPAITGNHIDIAYLPCC